MTKLPKGHLHCLSKAFKYTPAASTDVAKTFARARKKMEEEQRKNETEAKEKVRRLHDPQRHGFDVV